MSDKAPNLGDPLQVAVEVTQVKGSLALLTQQVSAGLANLSSQLAAVQAEQRDQGKSLREVAVSQHDMQSHSEGLERLARAIDRNSAEFAAWRKDHELENKHVSDRVTTFKGVLIGFTVVAALLSGAVVYIVQQGFNSAAAERQRIEQQHDNDITRLQKAIDKAEAEREELRKMRGLR